MEERTMTPEPREATVDYLRGMLAERVEATSLRRVAREVGMSPTGLKKFLLGTAPYSPTLRRLRKWYLHHAAVPTGMLVRDDAKIALDVLTYDVTPAYRGETVAALLDRLTEGYLRSGKPQPGWIAELRAEFQAAFGAQAARSGGRGGGTIPGTQAAYRAAPQAILRAS